MKLNICVYNVENLFIHKAGVHLPSDTHYKSDKKLVDLQRVFNDIDADVFALSEIGGQESLEYFNSHYLDSKYHVALIKGNSDRCIEIGFLIKKSLSFKYGLSTYKNNPLNFNYPHEHVWKKQDSNYQYPTYYMSRDLAELTFFDLEDLKKEIPLFNIFLVHLKSQRDSEGIDFRSVKRRSAELTFSLAAVRKFHEAIPECPVVFCGDFNGNASQHSTGEEFVQLYSDAKLEDVLNIADLPEEERSTYFLFNGSTRKPTQLDYAFIFPTIRDSINDIAIYRYMNSLDRPKCLPKNKYDVWNNPSDHYPLVFTIDI